MPNRRSAALKHTHVELDITDLGAYLTDAPSDGNNYGRKDGAWAVTGGGLPDAPSDGTIYGRKDAAWVATAGAVNHTGEVLGTTNLTVDITAITNQTDVVAADEDDVIIHDNSDGTLKKVNLSSITDAGYF